MELEPPHGYLAAAELLSDLRARDELSPYLLPDVWRRRDQISTITALSQSAGVCVAVGLSETVLPAAGQQKQGGLVRVALAVYVFQPAEGTGILPPDSELRERVWLTVLKYLSAWSYTCSGKSIKAYLTSTSEIDLATLNPDFARAVSADAVIAEIPLMLTVKKP